MMPQIYTGCAVWGHRPWTGQWLPATTSAAEMLAAYSARLTMVEVNSTFYALPQAATIERWVQDTPPDFRFCPKVPRAISHSGRLSAALIETEDFCTRMRGFGSRLGTIFLQLSPAFSPDQGRELVQWLARWPSDLPLAVEVRHPDWFQPRIADRLQAMLLEHQCTQVFVDSRPIYTGPAITDLVRSARRKKPDVPWQPELGAAWSLVRFMGHPDMSLNIPYLQALADQLITVEQTAPIYVAIHCPEEQHSPEMCGVLDALMQERGYPALLPSTVPGEQLTLL